MAEMNFHIAREFSRFPGGRLPKSGPYSGHELRERNLVPLLQKAIASGSVLHVDIDDVSTYAGSFLEEAFGGLIRAGFTLPQLKRHLTIEASGEYIDFSKLIWAYINEASLQSAH